MALAVKTDIKKDLTALHEMVHDTADFISSMQTAFIYNKPAPLLEPGTKIKAYMKEIKHIEKAFQQAAADNESARPYVSVPGHFMNILKSLQNISDLIDKKITEKVLFADKEVDESIYLFQRLVEILKPAADMILARNNFLGKYIKESQVSIERMSHDYSTLHENRLIIPAASSIYVRMLESIRSIAWNTKEIALKLGKKY